MGIYLGKKHWVLLLLSFNVLTLSVGTNCFAYRPFILTDAAVADKNELELELGAFSLLLDEEGDEVVLPSLKLNFGVVANWELVGEFGVQVYQEGEGLGFELVDPGLFLKGVLREGLLQGKGGPSVAFEFGALVPSTLEVERNFGFGALGILSSKIWDVVYHLNLGMEFDREDLDPHGIWGVILEYPFEGKLRAVAEVNGIFGTNGPPEHFALIGFIWEVGGVNVDFGIRKGLSEAAIDWEITSGVTFSF